MPKKPQYQPKHKIVTSKAMAQMRNIAFEQMPMEARKIISLQDRLVDDDARLAAAQAKRLRKAQKRIGTLKEDKADVTARNEGGGYYG